MKKIILVAAAMLFFAGCTARFPHDEQSTGASCFDHATLASDGKTCACVAGYKLQSDQCIAEPNLCDSVDQTAVQDIQSRLTAITYNSQSDTRQYCTVLKTYLGIKAEMDGLVANYSTCQEVTALKATFDQYNANRELGRLVWRQLVASGHNDPGNTSSWCAPYMDAVSPAWNNLARSSFSLISSLEAAVNPNPPQAFCSQPAQQNHFRSIIIGTVFVDGGFTCNTELGGNQISTSQEYFAQSFAYYLKAAYTPLTSISDIANNIKQKNIVGDTNPTHSVGSVL